MDVNYVHSGYVMKESYVREFQRFVMYKNFMVFVGR